MDAHTLAIILDIGYIAISVIVIVHAAGQIVALRILRKSRTIHWVVLGLGSVFAMVNSVSLLNDLSTHQGTHRPVDPTALGYLLGQLIIPLSLGGWYAVHSIRLAAALRAARRELLDRLKAQTLAAAHPEAAATVSALKDVLARQGRAALWQGIAIAFIFYALGVVTPYILTWLHFP